MRTPFVASFSPGAGELGEWWLQHVHFSKFSRQGIDIVCASFEQIKRKPIANIIIANGWADTLIRYADITRSLYECGFNIYLYDHQSQGLSGRWLIDMQSIWINSFEDYVDDFIYFTTSVTKDHPNLPTYVIGYCMGGLIASIAMSRLPSLVNRAILISPMLRNKCGIKYFNFSFSIPQPLARWCCMCASWAGLGAVHALGFFKEEASDIFPVGVSTTDEEQLQIHKSIRERYPEVIAACVTNDWLYQAVRSQRKFARRYEFVRTNTLILAAENDYFVYNRAMMMYTRKATAARMFVCKDALHDLLHEDESIRGATKKAILDYFTQKTDNAYLVKPPFSYTECDRNSPLYSVTESLFRTVGLVAAGIGIAIGVTMMFGPHFIVSTSRK